MYKFLICIIVMILCGFSSVRAETDVALFAEGIMKNYKSGDYEAIYNEMSDEAKQEKTIRKIKLELEGDREKKGEIKVFYSVEQKTLSEHKYSVTYYVSFGKSNSCCVFLVIIRENRKLRIQDLRIGYCPELMEKGKE